jgi:hypothetical protein
MLLAAVAIASTALAGCFLGSAAAGTAKAEESTATDHAKDEWASDAQLVAVIGFEGQSDGEAGFDFPADDEKAAQFFAKANQDDNVGDGKAEVWAYAYMAGSKSDQVYVVFVERDGTVLGADEYPAEDMDDLRPIGEYEVNSDEALRIAKEEDEGLRNGLESGNYGVVMGLAYPASDDFETQNAVWFVAGGGGDMEGGDGGFVVLDAVTGAVIFSSSMFADGMGGMGPWG